MPEPTDRPAVQLTETSRTEPGWVRRHKWASVLIAVLLVGSCSVVFGGSDDEPSPSRDVTATDPGPDVDDDATRQLEEAEAQRAAADQERADRKAQRVAERQARKAEARRERQKAQRVAARKAAAQARAQAAEQARVEAAEQERLSRERAAAQAQQQADRRAAAAERRRQQQAKPPPVSYGNCTDVENAGAAPLYQGEPGYSTDLDRDGDGIACDQ